MKHDITEQEWVEQLRGFLGRHAWLAECHTNAFFTQRLWCASYLRCGTRWYGVGPDCIHACCAVKGAGSPGLASRAGGDAAQ